MQLGKSGVDCETIRDFNQYYRGGFFGWPKNDGTVAPTYLRGVDNDRITCYTWDAEANDHLQVPMNWKDIQTRGVFGKLLLGNVRFGGTYYYLQYSAAREPFKGLRLESLTAFLPDYGHMGRAAVNKMLGVPRNSREHRLYPPFDLVKWNCMLLDSIYNPVFYGHQAAIRMLNAGDAVAVPITREVGVYLVKGSMDIHLSFRDLDNIGTLHNNGRIKQISHRFESLLPYLESTTEIR